MLGCLTKTAERSEAPSFIPEHQLANSSLQMDYDVELSDDLIRVHGSLLYPVNGSLGYLFLNATLWQDERLLLATKYLLMEVEPNRDYSFEICKSVRLSSGNYDFTLRAEGPQGILAEEQRKVSLATSQPGQADGSDDLWTDAREAMFWQKVKEEENERKKSERERNELEKVEQTQRSQSESTSDGSSLSKASASLQEEDVLLVGSITSKKYHRPDCRYAQKIKPENLISFKSVEDARAQGYLPCKVCNP